MVEVNPDIWEILGKVIMIVAPILIVIFGAVAKKLVDAIQLFLKKFKEAYEDGSISKKEWSIIVTAFLDVLIAALPLFFKNKAKAYINGIHWEGPTE